MDAGWAGAAASIIVALVAAGSAWASRRSAKNASDSNATTTALIATESAKLEAEKGAYDRARAFDTETIARQNKELAELRLEIHRQDLEIEDLRARNREQATRIFRLETGRLLPDIAKQEGKADESRTDTS